MHIYATDPMGALHFAYRLSSSRTFIRLLRFGDIKGRPSLKRPSRRNLEGRNYEMVDLKMD